MELISGQRRVASQNFNRGYKGSCEFGAVRVTGPPQRSINSIRSEIMITVVKS